MPKMSFIAFFSVLNQYACIMIAIMKAAKRRPQLTNTAVSQDASQVKVIKDQQYPRVLLDAFLREVDL